MKRLEYYNPKLDPTVPADDPVANSEPGGPLLVGRQGDGHTNLISSLSDTGWHYPALDIDVPCRYVESSTPGHGHLYFDDVRLNWDEYIALMKALVDAHIVHKSYMTHSLNRGQTLLRKPGIVKASRGRTY